MTTAQTTPYLRESTDQWQSCIEACVECWLACEMCSDACLDEEPIEPLVRCIRLDRECAEMCQAAARAMVRGSDEAPAICELCATLCDRCAEECERHEHGHCRACAEACRRCAEECRRMAA